MRKTFPVLALIAFACDSPRYVLVHGGPAREPEAAAARGDTYERQKEPRGQFDDTEASRATSQEFRARSSEPVGKWRSNGEALEPKWRDGDSVPLLPFSHYRGYSREEVDDVEQEDSPGTTRRPQKHRYAANQSNRPRGGSSRRAPSLDEYDYGLTHRGDVHDYDNPDVVGYPRKRRRPLKDPHDSTALYVDGTIEGAAGKDGKRDRNVVSSNDEKEATSARYREAFQAPNEYEHEFSDEEYLRPRPRKRRPPQNYEFALANEASSDEDESRDTPRSPSSSSSSSSSSLPERNEKPPMKESSDDGRAQNTRHRSENALELKSLLKMQQEEGSSLSEILQRRNLTLSDLLKGKADVINALKSRIADESDEYIEEMSRVMSNSLMKLATTVPPSTWRSTHASAAVTLAGTKSAATSSTSDNSLYGTAGAAVKTSTRNNLDEITANETNRATVVGTERMTRQQSTRDSPWLKTTTPPSITTMITTSSSPFAPNSMEYFLNDDNNAGLTVDARGGAKLESLDEDEIMEFSDFTDFKKAKSPANDGSGEPRDFESTLSIEQILSPTERIKLTKDCAGEQSEDSESDKDGEATRDESVSPGESSAEDYNAFIEAEYQNDAAIGDEDDGRRVIAKADSDASKRREEDQVEKKQSESRQASRGAVEKSRDRALENHRGASSARYDQIISEIEPEARAEIFELFASGSAGRRLERLLKSRNMSLEELIALRQRGSSKVHLTEVSRLRVPKPKYVPSDDRSISETADKDNEEIIVSLSPASSSEEEEEEEEEERFRGSAEKNDAEEPSSQFKQDIMSYLHDSFFDKGAENMSMSRLLDLVERDRNASSRGTTSSDVNDSGSHEGHGELENSRRTVHIVDLLTAFGSLPSAKDMQRHINDAEVGENGYGSETRLETDNDMASVTLLEEGREEKEEKEEEEEEGTARANDSFNELHTGHVEEVVKEKPSSIDIGTAYGETVSDAASGKGAGEERKTQSKVKPSIIASGAILGVTIVVFLAIFVVCRIRQKQRYTYRNTFSRAVFQGPVMAARKLSNSSSLSTVMVNVVATSTTKRPDRMETQEAAEEFDGKSDMDNDSLDANDSWETIPDYAK